MQHCMQYCAQCCRSRSKFYFCNISRNNCTVCPPHCTQCCTQCCIVCPVLYFRNSTVFSCSYSRLHRLLDYSLLLLCSIDKTCRYGKLKLAHGEKATDGTCAVVMECKNGFLSTKQCPDPPTIPTGCINPSLDIKRVPGQCCEMNWKCEMK